MKNHLLKKIILTTIMLGFFASAGAIYAQETPVNLCKVRGISFTPYGKQADGWYDKARLVTSITDSNLVHVTILTQNCTGKYLSVSITSKDAVGYNDIDINTFDERKVLVHETNTEDIVFLPGEEQCYGDNEPNCTYYVTVYPTEDGAIERYESDANDNPRGFLSYNCDGACWDNWIFSGLEDYLNAQQVQAGSNLQETGDYNLLAPLPGFTQTFDTKQGLAPYLVVVFRLLIGIAGLLAVVMIVLGGIEYMSSDAINDKKDGLEKVNQAVLGLLIALGAWLLLNTINPDILSLRFSPGQQTVTSVPSTGGTVVSPSSGGGNPYYDADGLAGYTEAAKGCTHTHKMTVEHFRMDQNVFTSNNPEIQANLNLLRQSFIDLNAKVKEVTGGGRIGINSAYRTKKYQKHFYEILSLYNELQGNKKSECAKLKQWVSNEKNSVHGIGSVVDNPEVGGTGPHTLGIGIDIGIPTVLTYAKLNQIAIDNNIPLRWQKLAGDAVHFNLINPPYPTPKGIIP